MKIATLPVPRTIASTRMTTCIWCHEPAPHAAVVRNQGLCDSCTFLNAEIGWRLVYDRDSKVGAIPRNLREAYRL